MKIKDGFMLRQFGKDYIVVAVGDSAEDFNRLITLNSVGAFLYNLMTEDVTQEELVDRITDSYEVDRSVAERDVKIFIQDVKKADLIDD